MKISKILLVMTVLVCLAFQAWAISESPNNISSNITKAKVPNGSNITMGSSESNIAMDSSGDYLNPNTISSGSYPNFPWYTTGGSFYSQPYSEITFSPFTEYYITSGMSVVGIISTPVQFDIAQKTPSRIYFGTGQALPYNQYISSVASRNNELWIQGQTDWSQYVVSPIGTWLQMVAYAPVGGPAGFYEIVQTDTNTLDYKTHQFYPGYNAMYFKADQVGRHMLYFVVNNQPSNVIIIDVFAQAQPVFQAPPQTVGVAGDTPVTIQTTMMGYDVYVDGIQVGKEGANEDALDGVFRFTVMGGQTHTMRIFDGMNNYEKPMYFERGVAKVINVPPATTVYTTGGLY